MTNIKKIEISIPNILKRIELGESIRQIAIDEGYSYSTLNRYVRKLKEDEDRIKGFDKYNEKSLKSSQGECTISCYGQHIICGISDLDLNDEISLLIVKDNKESIMRLDIVDQEFYIKKVMENNIIKNIQMLNVSFETFTKIKFIDYDYIKVVNYKNVFSDVAVIVNSGNEIKSNIKITIPEDFRYDMYMRNNLKGCFLINKRNNLKIKLEGIMKDVSVVKKVKDGLVTNHHVFKMKEGYVNKIKEVLDYENDDIIDTSFFKMI